MLHFNPINHGGDTCSSLRRFHTNDDASRKLSRLSAKADGKEILVPLEVAVICDDDQPFKSGGNGDELIRRVLTQDIARHEHLMTALDENIRHCLRHVLIDKEAHPGRIGRHPYAAFENF